jgi:hypothetical protein
MRPQINIRFYFFFFICGVLLPLSIAAKDKHDSNSCDENLIYGLLNSQLKISDNEFGCPYFLIMENRMIVNDSFVVDDSRYHHICKYLYYWDKSKVVSKFATVVSRDSINADEFTYFIFMPEFSSDKQCKISVTSSGGKVGSLSSSYYYKKRGEKWKMKKKVTY